MILQNLYDFPRFLINSISINFIRMKRKKTSSKIFNNFTVMNLLFYDPVLIKVLAVISTINELSNLLSVTIYKEDYGNLRVLS